MSSTTTLASLPYISFPSDTSLSEQMKMLEKALVEHPEDELNILRFIVPYATSLKDKHNLGVTKADRLLELAEDDDDRMEALISKGVILWQDRINPEEAEKLFIEAYNIDPEYQQHYENLCDMYMDRKEYAKALHWANLMIKQENLIHIGLGLKGDALLALNRVDDAIEAFEFKIKLAGNPATAHYGLGRCYALQENYEAARDACIIAFEKCHYPEPSYAYSVGFCYQQLDDPYRAMKWYSKALDIEPSLPEALNNMATLNHQLNNGWEEAVPYLLKAVELSNEAINSSMREVYRNLGAYYTNILDAEKAAYYSKLTKKCMGLDDDLIDFLDSFGDGDE